MITLPIYTSFSGYNQEDSLIMNQSSIDRGLFRSSFFRTYNGTCTKKQGSYNADLAERFEVPLRMTCSGLRQGSYEKLDSDGLAEPGARVSCDDILIGKTVPYPVSNPDGTLSQIARKDASIGMRSTENGIVDTVMLTTTQDGEVSVTVCRIEINLFHLRFCPIYFSVSLFIYDKQFRHLVFAYLTLLLILILIFASYSKFVSFL